MRMSKAEKDKLHRASFRSGFGGLSTMLRVVGLKHADEGVSRSTRQLKRPRRRGKL